MIARLVCFSLAMAIAPARAESPSLPPAATGEVDFAKHIAPLLNEHCVKCHGPEKQKGGLRLDHAAAALKGGDEGKVILPGNSAESSLIRLVAGLVEDKPMPPKGPALTVGQIGLLRAWIDHGTPWPETGKTVATSQHWSFQPIPPSASQGARTLDSFITEKLHGKGLSPAAPADPRALIRRLYFDLTGLPPSPGEVDSFVAECRDRTLAAASEALVERLLASPRHGERWGRHWLDVVRYTESQGFEYDHPRNRAWHYRDYVIKSFNDDKPYDQFMKEQLAGDVLEPLTSDGIVATSLLVCGPWDQAGNSQANQTQRATTREEEMEDMIAVVGQTFLGLTLNCARCHSHKFDPIPHEEYFRIKSVFDGVKHGERSVATPEGEAAHRERLNSLKAKIAGIRRTAAGLEAEGSRLAMAGRQGSGAPPPGPAPFLCWSFDAAFQAKPEGKLMGRAAVRDERLVLNGNKPSYFESEPINRDIREKTLEAWVSLANLDQGGGAAISLESEDDRDFDAIVFGERQKRKWVPGSGGFQRTRDLQDATDETVAPGALVHLAIVYHADNRIAVYRNGEPYGKHYTPSSGLKTFPAGRSRVLLGLRHHGAANGFLSGEVKQASLYDRALNAEEVAASYRSEGGSVTLEEALKFLTDVQRAEREAALTSIAGAEAEIKALEELAPISYAGVRVQPPPTHLLRRGNVTTPGDVVTPGALSALAMLDADFGLPADAPEAQRRLKFAGWIADPRNPLPARVMANRVWQYHFGTALVATPSDLGVNGSRPTHPDLLDWLAAKFIESGWSVKALHRLIVNSATYRQSSAANGRAMTLDADNTLLWRVSPRRLEAEAVRDAMLSVSGQINLEMGGPSFRPFTITTFNASFYHPVNGPDPALNRRTVYRMNVNSGKEPLLDAFDCPDPSVKTPRRGVTITPLQALSLMNNAFVQRQADGFAGRALTGAGGDLVAAVRTAYQLALSRDPNKEEAERALAAAKERGLASLCWALLNSTEFVYVQ